MKTPKTSKSQKINELVSELFSGKSLQDAESDDETARVKISEFDHREHDGSDADDDQLDNQLSEFRKKNLVLLNEVDEKYRGAVVSRKHLESDDEEENDVQSGEEDDENQSENDKEQSEYDDEEQSEDDDEEQSEDDNEEQSEDEDDEQFADEAVNDSDEENEIVSDQSAESEQEHSSQAIFSMKRADKSVEIKKGLAVQNQLKIWEHLLELRIHSQKLIAHSNSLPPYNILNEMTQLDDDLAKEMESLQSGALNLIDNLIELQKTLVSGFPDTISLELKKPRRKRKYEENVAEYSNVIEHNYNKYKPYGDTTIQKWYDRTKVFSNNLKSKTTDDTNIIRRIDTILMDKGDLIKKSQHHKGGYELYNPDLNKTLKYEAKEGKQILDVVEPDVKTSNSADVSPHEKNVYSTEIYDDTDFYHQLLRGLIEFKTSTLTNPQEISKQYAELEKLRKKMKKVVDTRASKGRKLRYVVHKKLVNFMAPNPHCEWTSDACDELFTSLFGKLDNKMILNDG